MSNYTSSSELFFTELMRISTDIVWKNPTLAKKYEDSSQSVYVEQYILARQGKLTFDLIFSFDYDVLIASGLTEKQAADGSEVSYEIPESKRDICTANQIKRILESYDEPNNYYRMLNGLPDKGDTDFVYNTKYPDISDSKTPIHLLSEETIYLLENNGYINELIETYPDKEYLKYMGEKKIDPYTARKSEEYSILWIKSSEFSSLVDDFTDTYNVCRYMITSIYTSYYGRISNEEYTGFIGMTILFATIMQMHKLFLDADITRDFYDQDSLKYVYDSYGVPFYSSIPMEYHKLIVKNINRLISYKGSTQVIYELFDIFALPEMSVFEYYILKQHKFKDGKPIFVKNEDGSYNYREMYDVKFSKVHLLNDPVTDITNSRNHIKYDDMVNGDPYWITDEALLDKLYSEEYNYNESKYIGIQTTFDMMKIVYECCYYIKMIVDNRKALDATTIFNNNTKSQVNLFDSIIYTCALLCKNYGYEGNIPTKPHEIGQFLGFNFKVDLEELRKHVSESDYLKNDAALLNYLISMKVYSLESVTELYTRMTELRTYLVNKMAETSIPDEYWAYYNLYNTLMYSEYAEGVFTKSDGTVAESFADMLKDCNYELYNRYQHSDEFDINEEISYMLYSIKNSCSALENIEYLDNVNINIIVEYMLKLINFFKSSKADVTEYIIVYSLVHALDNWYKLMGYIERISDSMSFVDYIDELDDLLVICRKFIHIKDIMYQLLMVEKSSHHRHYIVDCIAYLQDHIKIISHLVKDITDDIEIYDYMRDINIFLLEDEYTLKDMVTLLYDDVQEIIKYMVQSEMYTHDVITTIKEVLKDSGRLKSEYEFESQILSIIASQKLKTSYNLDASIPEIFTLDTHTFVYAFTDSMLNTLTQYHLSFSENTYHTIIDTIIEHIGLLPVDSKYRSDGTVDRGSDTIDLTQISAENYVRILAGIIENIFIHYMNSELIIESDLRRTERTTAGTTTMYHMDTESLYSLLKMKRTSSNVLTDQIVLLHESTEEE